LPHNDVVERQARNCRACGAELHFSHRKYAGRGLQAAVWRCAGCGTSVREEARSRAPAGHRTGRVRPPVDDGPPQNPVLDPETAMRVLGRDVDET